MNESGPDYYIITSKYTSSYKDPVEVVWSIFRNKKTQSYKILNVQIGGVSYVLNLRSQFDSTISKYGIDGLITKLKEKSNQ